MMTFVLIGLGLCVVVGLLVLFLIGASIDLVLYLISAILPFVLCVGGGMLAVAIIGAIINAVKRRHRRGDISEKALIITSVTAGLIVYGVFMYAPRPALPFRTQDVALVAYYNLSTGKTTDYVNSDERLGQLKDILGGMKMHYHHAKRVPDYLGSLGEVDVEMWLGIFDSDLNKLAEIRLTDSRLIGVYYPDREKEVVYDLYRKPDLDELDRIRRAETHERTKARIESDNGNNPNHCLKEIVYEDGNLVIPLHDLVYQEDLELSLKAVAQSLKFSYALEDLDLLEEADMSRYRDNGETIYVPVPQDRRFTKLEAALQLDGISYSLDITSLLPAELLKK